MSSLRTRLRRAFARSSQERDTADSRAPARAAIAPSKSSKSSKSPKKQPKPPSSVYKPGEKLPPLKYRRPVDPIHKANLEAFSWAKAWRRNSESSMYSPMGSRMPSRKNSIVSFRRCSFSSRKGSSRGNDTLVDSGIGGSIASDALDDEDRDTQTTPEPCEGSDSETDVAANVRLSRHPTNDQATHTDKHRPRSVPSRSAVFAMQRRRTVPNSTSAELFTPEDLELALQRSHLNTIEKVSRRGLEADSTATSTQLDLPSRQNTAFAMTIP